MLSLSLLPVWTSGNKNFFLLENPQKKLPNAIDCDLKELIDCLKKQCYQILKFPFKQKLKHSLKTKIEFLVEPQKFTNEWIISIIISFFCRA